MLLGFISLLLTVGQKPISMICISESLGNTMLPCKNDMVPSYVEHAAPENKDDVSGWLYHYRSFWRGVAIAYMKSLIFKRILATNNVPDHCADKGMVPLVSQGGIHQLHIFIFALAVFHILYCILTLALGRDKMRRWKVWEQETKTVEYKLSNYPSRFRFTRQTSFGRHHMSF